MADDRFTVFWREHVRTAILSMVIGIGFATILAAARPNPRWVVVLISGAVVGLSIWIGVDILETLFRPSIARFPERARPFGHSILFIIAGIAGWILGNVTANLIFGEQVNVGNLVRGRGLTFMAITCGIVVAVGLIIRAMEIMRDRLARSLQSLKENEWAQKELEMARAIQKRLLPPQRIEGQGFSIAARNFPAHMVAGDFYDVVKLDDGSVAVIVADVAGKGMGASLIMASVKAVLPFVGRGSVEEAMTTLNEKLVQELERREFVALAFARFFPSTGVLHLANAGFPDPYLIRGTTVEPLVVTGMRLPLGVRPGARYETLTSRLLPGDRLVFVSDGIPEAPVAGDQLLGYDRLADALRVGGNAGADDWLEELLTRIRSEVREPLADDWTALVLQFAANAQIAA